MYTIGLVCSGNICRSPTADVVLNARVAEAGLADRVRVVSSGTGDWHVGEPMDHRSAATLRAAGYDPSRHRAQQLDASWFDLDLLLVMDRANLTAVRRLGGDAVQVRLFRDFDPVDPGSEVPDPYYGGEDGFAEVLAIVERTTTALVDDLAEQLHD